MARIYAASWWKIDVCESQDDETQLREKTSFYANMHP